MWRVRCFSKTTGTSHRNVSWDKLSENERLAWQQLGWNKSKWEGIDSAPHISHWNEMSASQKSVVQYGLNINEVEWNRMVSNKELLTLEKKHTSTSISSSTDSNADGNTSNAVVTASTYTSAVSIATNAKSVAAKVAWSALKYIGPAANIIPTSGGGRHSHLPIKPLGLAAMGIKQLPTFIDEFSDPVIIAPGSIETVLYLDDSGSMSGNLGLGKAALQSMGELLQHQSTYNSGGGSGSYEARRAARLAKLYNTEVESAVEGKSVVVIDCAMNNIIIVRLVNYSDSASLNRH